MNLNWKNLLISLVVFLKCQKILHQIVIINKKMMLFLCLMHLMTAMSYNMRIVDSHLLLVIDS